VPKQRPGCAKKKKKPRPLAFAGRRLVAGRIVGI